MRPLNIILADLELRTNRKSSKYYKPLEDPEEREAVINHYKDQIKIAFENGPAISNAGGTQIATGYDRIVTGDYGAYVEFNKGQAIKENFEPKFKGEPKRKVKYLWLQTTDELKTKIYLQYDRVKYADYLPGYYYVAVSDVRYYIETGMA